MNIKDDKKAFSKPNPSPNYNYSEYDSLMEESKECAKEAGMKQSDIDDAIKSVRKRTYVSEPLKANLAYFKYFLRICN